MRTRSTQKRISRSLRSKDRKSTRLNSSHSQISYAVFCLKKKNKHDVDTSVQLDQDLETLNRFVLLHQCVLHLVLLEGDISMVRQHGLGALGLLPRICLQY